MHRARDHRLVGIERRKEPRERTGEECLSRAGRADEQEAVTTRRRDLEGALRRLVTADVREVDGDARRWRGWRDLCRRAPRLAGEVRDRLAQ